MFYLLLSINVTVLISDNTWGFYGLGGGHKVDCVDFLLLYLISLDPKMNETYISQLDL